MCGEARAFSSEVDTGSREENASKQEIEPRSDSIGTEKAQADHVPSSLNLLATSSVIASSAAWASGPVADTTIDVPGPADSIISPMMEVPPTVSPPLVTHT